MLWKQDKCEYSTASKKFWAAGQVIQVSVGGFAALYGTQGMPDSDREGRKIFGWHGKHLMLSMIGCSWRNATSAQERNKLLAQSGFRPRCHGNLSPSILCTCTRVTSTPVSSNPGRQGWRTANAVITYIWQWFFTLIYLTMHNVSDLSEAQGCGEPSALQINSTNSAFHSKARLMIEHALEW